MGSKDINRSNLTHSLWFFQLFLSKAPPILHTIHKAAVVFCLCVFRPKQKPQARWKEMGLEMDLFLGMFGVEKKQQKPRCTKRDGFPFTKPAISPERFILNHFVKLLGR